MTQNSCNRDAAAKPLASEELVIGGARWRVFWIVLGPLILIGWIGLVPRQLSPEAHRLVGVLLLTLTWWLSEPIPISMTGLLAVCLSVILGCYQLRPGERPEELVLAPFADPTLYFLVGGMFIGQGMMRHGLDRRFALSALSVPWAAGSPMAVIAAMGLVVTFISMWVSNTAATAMIYPIGMGVIAVLSGRGSRVEGREPDGESLERSRFASALLLTVAFGSSIGGVATPIGTATNLVVRGVLQKRLGLDIPFVQWATVGVPVMLLLYVGLMLWFRPWAATAGKIDLPALRESFRFQRQALGPFSRGELNTLVTFLIVVTLWVAPGVLALVEGTQGEIYLAYKKMLPEAIVALLAPVLLFLLPVDLARGEGTLKLEDIGAIDWGTVLLFGSGLSLSVLMQRTGLDDAMGQWLSNTGASESLWPLTAISIVAAIVLSEFTSNVAAATVLLPVVIGVCEQAGLDPVFPALGAGLGASFGSCLPVSTPPNAIVYGSRLIPLRRMVVAGLGMDLIAASGIWLVLRLAAALGWRAAG